MICISNCSTRAVFCPYPVKASLCTDSRLGRGASQCEQCFCLGRLHGPWQRYHGKMPKCMCAEKERDRGGKGGRERERERESSAHVERSRKVRKSETRKKEWDLSIEEILQPDVANNSFLFFRAPHTHAHTQQWLSRYPRLRRRRWRGDSLPHTLLDASAPPSLPDFFYFLPTLFLSCPNGRTETQTASRLLRAHY